MTQQTPFFEPIEAMEVLEAVVALEGEVTRLRAINAELLKEGEDLAEKLDIERGENTRLRRQATVYVEAVASRDKVNAELLAALRPFSLIGIGENPDYRPTIRLAREEIIAARAAIAAAKAEGR